MPSVDFFYSMGVRLLCSATQPGIALMHYLGGQLIWLYFARWYFRTLFLWLRICVDDVWYFPCDDTSTYNLNNSLLNPKP